MTALTAFLPYVLPYVPNCLDDSAVIALRSAAIEFCHVTGVLQQDLDPVAVTAGTATYDLDVDAGHVPVRVLSLYFDGRVLSRSSEMQLNGSQSTDWQTESGTPTAFTQFRSDQVVLLPNPDVAGTLTGRVVLGPSRTATTVDDRLFQRHLDTIVEGALSILMAMPNQPFTDLKGARDYGVLFRVGITKAHALVNAGFSQAPMQVRMRPFA